MEERQIYIDELDREYKIYRVKARDFEEWPSEEWNFQDKFPLKSLKSMEVSNREKIDSSQPEISGDEGSPEVEKHIDISNEELERLLLSVKGLGKKKLSKILSRYSTES